MAYERISLGPYQLLIGLSSETKPDVSSVPLGSRAYEADTDATYIATPTGWKRLREHVRVNEAGTPASARLVARHTAPTSDQIWKSVGGCTQWFAQAAGALTPGTGVIYTQGLAIAVSTIYDDHAGIGTLLAAALANFGTSPVEPVTETASVFTLWTANDRVSSGWDGETRIKSIGAMIIGATPGEVANGVAIALTTVS